MKNITLSADEKLIKKARARAERENTTLNAEFRKWLARYVCLKSGKVDYQALMDRLYYAKPGKIFSRDELNAR